MRVLVQNANRTTDKTYIWSMTGNQGNSWKKAVVDIGQLPAGYKVRFVVKFDILDLYKTHI